MIQLNVYRGKVTTNGVDGGNGSTLHDSNSKEKWKFQLIIVIIQKGLRASPRLLHLGVRMLSNSTQYLNSNTLYIEFYCSILYTFFTVRTISYYKFS